MHAQRVFMLRDARSIGSDVVPIPMQTAYGQKTVCLQGLFALVIDSPLSRDTPSATTGTPYSHRSRGKFPMTNFFSPIPSEHVISHHRAQLEVSAAAGHGVYLGHDHHGWRHAKPQHSVMALGPQRSGKTTSLIIPNVLSANGAVVSTSTKPDVLDATIAARSRLGRCFLFDPTGSVDREHDVAMLQWSPLRSCATWMGSLSMAHSLVEVTSSSSHQGSLRPESSHWNERAQAMLAPLLHAAALDGRDMRTVLTWVDRRQALPAQQILAGEPGRSTELARNLLDGIVTTDERELSGIWPTQRR